MQQDTQCKKSRHQLACAWLRQNGLRFQDVADRLGVAKSSISRTLKAATIPTRRHAQLMALGIPKEFLPIPLDITPGPKRKGVLLPIVSDSAHLPALPR